MIIENPNLIAYRDVHVSDKGHRRISKHDSKECRGEYMRTGSEHYTSSSPGIRVSASSPILTAMVKRDEDRCWSRYMYVRYGFVLVHGCGLSPSSG